MVEAERLVERLRPFAIAPRVHVAHQDRGPCVHLWMLEERLDLSMSGAIDQREMRRDDAQPHTRMADMGGQCASALDA